MRDDAKSMQTVRYEGPKCGDESERTPVKGRLTFFGWQAFDGSRKRGEKR